MNTCDSEEYEPRNTIVELREKASTWAVERGLSPRQAWDCMSLRYCQRDAKTPAVCTQKANSPASRLPSLGSTSSLINGDISVGARDATAPALARTRVRLAQHTRYSQLVFLAIFLSPQSPAGILSKMILGRPQLPSCKHL